MNSLYSTLIEVLKQKTDFFSESGELLRNAVYEAAMKMDPSLIKLLADNETTKKRFFTDIDGVLVFDKVGFGWVINNKEFLPDSYTRFKNKIGLVDESGSFISSSDNVELVFPYKDCVLEGGQTKEDQKRSEIFYNETLAPDEVDRLLYPKVLSNATRYTSNGNEKITEFSDNDNLIIKGNNLLAIASLKRKFAGRIKLIYIDPPYNTGTDSFGYNDRFNHSSWLTFMQNRLRIARELLSSDGVICIQCDDNENAYLKVLMDSIFKGGFLNNIAVKMSEATGVKMNHVLNRFPKLKEYILIYVKPEFKGFYEVDKYRKNEWDKENNIFLDNFTYGDRNRLIELELKDSNTDEDCEEANHIFREVKMIPINRKIKELGLEGKELDDWRFNNAYRIIKTAGSSSLSKIIKGKNRLPEQEIAAELSSKGVLFYYITDFNQNTDQPRIRVIFADSNIYKNPCDFWQDIKTTGAIAQEGDVLLLNGKKPEKLLHRLIKMITKEGDIVLDFFGGSGTTGAVAHKMKRQYILCEQIDGHIEKQIARLNNVINGDATGISSEVDWQGGGSFVYCELAKLNQHYVDKIESATTDAELIALLAEIIDTDFISCKVNPAYIKENAKSFEELSIGDKKRFLMELLDKNQLYVNYCDIDDENYHISEEDKAFTKSFYGDK